MNWQREYGECRLCPRGCGVDRTVGETGVCGETAQCRVASACTHMGEEPPITGARGSGTIFFTGCPCRCFFCQNSQISRHGLGTVYPLDELVDAACALLDAGAHNLNFVTPDHVLPHVRELCRLVRRRGYAQPFVFNGSGYHTPDAIDSLDGIVDIYLPDVKFADAELARQCMGDGAYPDIALAALERMVAQVGYLEPWDPTGAVPATKGVLVRHLVMPGHVQNSLDVLQRLRKEFGRMLPLSVMSQFRPMPECANRGLLTRCITHEEYRQVCDCVQELGFLSVFVQPDHGDDGFVPDFTRRSPFRGNRREE